MEKYSQKENKRRYNLHYRIRKQGFDLKTKQKTIVTPLSSELLTPQVKILINSYGYVVQASIF